MSNLQPARNVRSVIPRVCATCGYGDIEDGGGFACQRTDARGYSCFSCDSGDMTHWLTVCDCYKIASVYTPLKADDIARRSQGALHGWEIRRAKEQREREA